MVSEQEKDWPSRIESALRGTRARETRWRELAANAPVDPDPDAGTKTPSSLPAALVKG